MAKKVGLPAGIPVAVGAFDAHMGAVGAGIKPGTLVKIIGTSTCDMMVAPMDDAAARHPRPLRHRARLDHAGHVRPGGGPIGRRRHLQLVRQLPRRRPQYTAKGDPHANLTREAAKLKPGESGLLALDWNNGNRTILVDPLLTGLLVGQTLHTTAPEIYRALIEATAFGALTIINRFEEYGVTVEEVVNCGGIAEKNPFVMQIYADVCNRPMKISRSAQTCALGAAIFGAVVGGAYDDVEQAQQKMTGVKPHGLPARSRQRGRVCRAVHAVQAAARRLRHAWPTDRARPRDEGVDRHPQSGAERLSDGCRVPLDHTTEQRYLAKAPRDIPTWARFALWRIGRSQPVTANRSR